MTASHSDRVRGAESHASLAQTESVALGHVGGLTPNGAGDDIVTLGYPYNGGVPTSVDGGAGTDTLVVAWGLDNNNVSLTSSAGSGAAGGYDGAVTDSAVSSTVAFTSFEKFNVTTGNGNDSLTAGAGADTVNAGLGTDTVSLGAGSDLLVVDYSAVSNPVTVASITDNGANGYSGSIHDIYGYNTVNFDGVEAFQLTSGVGNDTIALGNATATILSGSGDDSINSGTALDNLDAGAGNDRWSADLSAQSAAIALDLRAGTYSGPGVVTGFEGVGVFSSGAGADFIKLGTLGYNETVSTNGGADTVLGAGYGQDTVHMGLGTDTLGVDLSGDGQPVNLNGVTADAGGFSGSIGDIYGYQGVTFDGVDAFNIVTAGGNDRLDVGNVQATINTGAGDDFISTGSGVDNLNGGDGADGWSANYSAATVAIALNLQTGTYTGVGTATGFEYLGTFSSGTKADNIKLGTGNYNETVNTNGGNDTVAGAGYGLDTVHMGAGTDTLVIDLSTDNQQTNLTGVTADAGGFGGTIGDVYGYDSVTFDGVDLLNITTGAGSDRVNVGNIQSTINTGVGDDFISSGTGASSLNGGDGNDGWSADFTTATVAISLDLTTGAYTGVGTATGFEYVGAFSSGTKNDSIKLGTGAYNETVSTNGGADTVSTGFGNDTIHMGAGTDTLIVDLSNDAQPTSTSGFTDNGVNGFSGFIGDPYGFNSVTFDGVEAFNIRTGGSGDYVNLGNALATISTGAGDDVIVGGTSVDSIDGGDGTDSWSADLSAQTAAISLDLVAQTYTGPGSVAGIEYLGTLTTGSGADNIKTRGGYAEGITTNGGNDTVATAGGADTVHMGSGVDTLIIDYSTAGIYGVGTYSFVDNGAAGYSGAYSDPYGGGYYSTTFDGVEAFNITTGGATDNINTGNGAATVSTGGGDDFITTGTAVDVLDGGAGIDGWSADLSAQTAAINLNLLAGTYSGPGAASGFEYVGVFSSGSGADTITTGSGHSENISTNAGDDTVSVLDAADTVHMGAGTDTLIIDYSAAGIYGVGTYGLTDNGTAGYSGAFSDPYGGGYYSTNFDGVERFVITTGAAGDNINTGNAAATINTGAGDDFVTSGTAVDVLTGGAGTDGWSADLSAQTTAIVLDLQAGTYSGPGTASGFEYVGVFSSGSGADNIKTASGNHSENISTNGGNDTVTTIDASDTVHMGSGFDTLIIDYTTADIYGLGTYNFTGSAAAGYAGVYSDPYGSGYYSTYFDGVESFNITGGAAGDNIATGDNADTLAGGGGNDSLTALGGADILDGGIGADTLVGGAGNDTYVVDDTGDVVAENAGEGVDTVQSSITYILADPLENLTLTGADSINGTGNGADNIIIGNAGANTLLGLGGNDTITGGAGGDSLDGGANNDSLDGGLGADTMVGGLGNDTFVVNDSGDVVTEVSGLGSGTDTVQASINYTLAANVENLLLTGSGPLTGTGNGAANVITGNSGANTLDGAAGADTLKGGLGDDVYLVDAQDTVTENLNEGTDTVRAAFNYALGLNVENLVLLGSAGLTGTGNALANSITGNGGANSLDGGAGADTLVGGLGDDIYVVDDAGDVVTENLDEGADTVQSSITYTLGANVEKLLLTGAGDLAGAGNGLANALTGNGGNNTLDGGAGADTLVGGLGNDTYVVDDAGDAVTETAGEGLDTVRASINYTLGANLENLVLTGAAAAGTGNASDNVLTGTGANNTLDGGQGNDTLVGGQGDDTYLVDNKLDVITENVGEGTDTVRATSTYTLGANLENLVLIGSGAFTGVGNNGANTITANDSGDSLNGASGNDTLIGGLGDDTLNGGVGTDSLAGGGGNDVYLVDSLGDTVTEALNAGLDTVQSAVSFTLGANIENLVLTGSAGSTGVGNTLNNQIDGNSGANSLQGGAGADTLNGGGGSDTLDGGALSDVLNGGAGADSMMGGVGNDTYTVDNIGDVVVELANAGSDTVQTALSYTLGANVENLTLTGTGQVTGTGNSLDNVIRGNAKDNTLVGGLGTDTLSGGHGRDTASYADASGAVTVDLSSGASQNTGSAGFDTLTGIEHLVGSAFGDVLTGGNKANHITGGAGADTITGGHGADLLSGGVDADTFRFNSVLDSKSANPDRITDLQGADIIDLHLIDADSSTSADDAFHVVAAFTKHVGELVVSYDAGTGRTTVEGDVNGDKHADFTLLLDGDQTGFTGYVL